MHEWGWSVKPGNKHLVDEKRFNGTLEKVATIKQGSEL